MIAKTFTAISPKPIAAIAAASPMTTQVPAPIFAITS
jgi:hypothetical protein